MSKETLTVVIITKNEEDKIARCLKSVKWADEIIVIDDLSTDRTAQICQEYGAKVIAHRCAGNFDYQRNIGIEHSRGNWILQMDADEMVSPGLKAEIERLLHSNCDYAGIEYKRKNYFLGQPLLFGGWHHDFLRLFRKNAGRFTGSGVHESLEVKGKIGRVNADMEHYISGNISQVIEKQNYYTSLGAQRLWRERGIVSEKEIKYHLTIKPLKLFWKTYVKKRGFRDGLHGLIYCLLDSISHFLKWAKYWELVREKKGR
jgi:glycosyltransferase involved in cell wall biosynthesis